MAIEARDASQALEFLARPVRRGIINALVGEGVLDSAGVTLLQHALCTGPKIRQIQVQGLVSCRGKILFELSARTSRSGPCHRASA